jgi:hypothetical protein
MGRRSAGSHTDTLDVAGVVITPYPDTPEAA